MGDRGWNHAADSTRAPIVPQNLEPVDLVAAEHFQMSAQDKEDYDGFSDFDAREPWGSFFLP